MPRIPAQIRPRALRRAAARAVCRLHLWSRAGRWVPSGMTSRSPGLPPPLARRRLPVHTGEDPRAEVIVPSARAPSSRELTDVRRSRSPPNGATSTPSSSSDDHRDWVLPGILSGDLDVPPSARGVAALAQWLPARCLPPASAQEVVREAGAPRSDPPSRPLPLPCASYPGFPRGTSRSASLKGDAFSTSAPARP